MKKQFYILIMLTTLCITSCEVGAYSLAISHIRNHLGLSRDATILSASGYANSEFKTFKIVFEIENSSEDYTKLTGYTVYSNKDGNLCCLECEPSSEYCSNKYYLVKEQGKKIYPN